MTKITRQELIGLHTHYEGVIKDELDLFFKYFNFYIGILSALLAATLTGLLSFKPDGNQRLEYVLIVGPVLICCLSLIAYSFIRVYYRRFLEALVTVRNIKEMLGYTTASPVDKGIENWSFPSQFGGGFITQFNRKETKRIFDEGRNNRLQAEEILDQLLKRGDTLQFAKLTLALYFGVAIFLAVKILITAGVISF